jgi:hypothetical protein
MKDGRRKTEDGRWKVANGKWQMANGKWQMANGNSNEGKRREKKETYGNPLVTEAVVVAAATLVAAVNDGVAICGADVILMTMSERTDDDDVG